MKIAVFVISILVIIVMLLQSCAVFGLSSVSDSLEGTTDPSDTTSGGAMGIAAALAAFVGMAFVLAMQRVALIAYLLGAIFAFMGGALGFSDMTMWGVVLLILAAMTWYARRQEQKSAAET